MRRAYWTVLGLVVAFTLALVVATWWLGRRQHDVDLREQRLRDSLQTLEVKFAALTERERVATITLKVSNRLLDSALAKAPQIVYVPRTRTIVTPAGKDSAAVDSLPYIAKADYDTLASRCRNVQVGCEEVVALKDSLLTVRSGEASSLRRLLDVAAERRDLDRRRSRFAVLRGFGFGLGAGALGCAILCR